MPEQRGGFLTGLAAHRAVRLEYPVGVSDRERERIRRLFKAYCLPDENVRLYRLIKALRGSRRDFFQGF